MSSARILMDPTNSNFGIFTSTIGLKLSPPWWIKYYWFHSSLWSASWVTEIESPLNVVAAMQLLQCHPNLFNSTTCELIPNYSWVLLKNNLDCTTFRLHIQRNISKSLPCTTEYYCSIINSLNACNIEVARGLLPGQVECPKHSTVSNPDLPSYTHHV